jgi:hypothetical protein
MNIWRTYVIFMHFVKTGKSYRGLAHSHHPFLGPSYAAHDPPTAVLVQPLVRRHYDHF